VRLKTKLVCETCRKTLGFAEAREQDVPCCYCSEKCFKQPDVDQRRMEREDKQARADAERIVKKRKK
jgi:hypothetical protein